MLRCILHYFEAISRLHINFTKCVIYGVGHTPILADFAVSLGSSNVCLLTTYIGLPLGASYKSKENWNLVLCKIQKKLSNWKCSLLSKGGKLNLKKKISLSLPTYYKSLFVILASVAKITKKLQKKICGKGGRKLLITIWWPGSVCQPKRIGGVGLRLVTLTNKVLLCERLWYFGAE